MSVNLDISTSTETGRQRQVVKGKYGNLVNGNPRYSKDVERRGEFSL